MKREEVFEVAVFSFCVALGCGLPVVLALAFVLGLLKKLWE